VDSLKPGDLVGVNKDSFLILESLPAEYDSRVKAMEIDERPSEDYADIGGLDKQIEELVEAVVLPMTHPERFKKIGIKPPKGMHTVELFRSSYVRAARHWQDIARKSMCCTNKGYFFEASRTSISSGTLLYELEF
jgi:hypothetical protein